MNRNRVPKGVSTGGQFTAGERGQSTVRLGLGQPDTGSPNGIDGGAIPAMNHQDAARLLDDVLAGRAQATDEQVVAMLAVTDETIADARRQWWTNPYGQVDHSQAAAWQAAMANASHEARATMGLARA